MLKLSIIVPVYNVQPYIVRCINSILNQNVSSDDYEIIVINDGSTDNSIDVLANSILNDKYIFLEHSNKGLSYTRNRGLKEAKGEYIWYIDSDDWITDNVLSDVFAYLNGVDVLALCSFIKEGNWSGYKTDFIKSNKSTGKELCGENHLTSAQFYIYRRQFLIDNDLFFFEGIFHEDADLTPRILYLCDSISYFHYPIYHFLKRGGSITTTINPKRASDYMLIIDRAIAFYNSSVKADHKKYFLNIIADDFLEVMKIALCLTDDYQDSVRTFVKKNSDFVQCFLYSSKLKVRIMGLVCFLFPKHIFLIYKTMSKFNYFIPTK